MRIKRIPADYRHQSWGWAYQILPYIEQENLWAYPQDSVIAATAVSILYVSLVPRPHSATLSQGTDAGDDPIRAMMDYTACVGSYYGNYDGAIVPTMDIEATAGKSGLTRKITDITDGTSNTMLIGEKYVDFQAACDPNYNGRGGTAYGPCNDDQGWVDGWDNDTICDAYGQQLRSVPSSCPSKFARTKTPTIAVLTSARFTNRCTSSFAMGRSIPSTTTSSQPSF